jgi:hypothetical protein
MTGLVTLFPSPLPLLGVVAGAWSYFFPGLLVPAGSIVYAVASSLPSLSRLGGDLGIDVAETALVAIASLTIALALVAVAWVGWKPGPAAGIGGTFAIAGLAVAVAEVFKCRMGKAGASDAGSEEETL